MDNVKVLFIYPDLGWNSINFSPALLCLSTFLKKHLLAEIKLLHLNDQYAVPYNPERICREIMDFSPDLVGMTCTTYAYQQANEIAAGLKTAGFASPVILGGSHAQISYNDLIDSSFDAFCTGEGEVALLDLCRRIMNGDTLADTPGFAFKKDGGVVVNSPARVLTDLDELPLLEYSLMDVDKILQVRNGWMNVAFSRGCPYACTFCINQALRDVYRRSTQEPYIRHNSVERAMESLLWLVEHHPSIKVFNFDDDLLLLDKDWFLTFSAAYKKHIFKLHGIKYVINARANLLSAELIDALATSGCFEAQVGFETGNEELRNKILRKQITNEQLNDAFGLCREKGVRTLAYTMIGVPEENCGTVRETIRVLSELKPTLIRMTIFDPFRGTPLYDYCVAHNLFKSETSQAANHFTSSRLRFTDLDDHGLLRFHLLYPWYLNVALGTSEAEYRQGIDQYGDMSYDELRSDDVRRAVMAYDAELSTRMTGRGLPHFRYFKNNPFYYEYWDC